MKLQSEDSTFKPVTLTLESQDEVSQLYALLNCKPIMDILKGMSPKWEVIWKELRTNHIVPETKKSIDRVNEELLSWKRGEADGDEG